VEVSGVGEGLAELRVDGAAAAGDDARLREVDERGENDRAAADDWLREMVGR
jgi:hypothetical protein